MGYTLYLAEKPKMGRLIASSLARLEGSTEPKEKNDQIRGNGWAVGWLAGHAYSLYDRKDYTDEWNKSWTALTLPIIPDHFKYKPIEADYMERYRSALQSLLKDADTVVISTDAGQEGQIIAEIFLQENNWQGPTLRLWTSATNTVEMKRALSSLESNDLMKYQGNKRSGLVRTKADWLIGINFSIAYTVLAQKAGYDFLASAGRVQSCLLSICVDHDAMVESFKSANYYELEAIFETPNGEHIKAKLNTPAHLLGNNKYCMDEEGLNLIRDEIKSQSAQVKGLTSSQSKYSPPTPFNLTTLCIVLSRSLGISSGEAVALYQAMYEAGILTYPRTEDIFYEDNQLSNVNHVFNMLRDLDPLFIPLVDGADTSLKPSSFDSSKIEEHPANSPTTSKPNWASLCPKSKDIYVTVAKQMIAQFYSDHISSITTALIGAGGYSFAAKGKTILQEGWGSVISHEDANADLLEIPSINKGDDLKLMGLDVVAKKTRAPARMTEAKLLGIMKDASNYLTSEQTKARLGQNACLGTAATRPAAITSLIDDRKYLSLSSTGIIRPTKIGKQVRALLPPELTSPDLTAIWEINFKRIRAGQMDPEEFLDRLKGWVKKQIDKTSNLKLTPNPLAHFCRTCSGIMVRKTDNKDRGQKYWRCQTKTCGIIIPDLGGKPLEPLPGDGESCQECGTPYTTRLKKFSGNDLAALRAQGERRYLMCSNRHFRNSNKSLKK